MCGSRENTVERVGVALRCEAHHVVSDADRGMRRNPANLRRGAAVRGQEVIEHAIEHARVRNAGRNLAVEVAGEQKDERLVERNPESNAVAALSEGGAIEKTS